MNLSIRERKDRSVHLQGLINTLNMARKSAGDHPWSQQVVDAAKRELVDIDQAFEVASRSIRMADQMLDGEWPLQEAAAMRGVLEKVRMILQELLDRGLLRRVVGACNVLEDLGGDDRKNLQMAGRALESLDNAGVLLGKVVCELEPGTRKSVKNARALLRRIKKHLH